MRTMMTLRMQGLIGTGSLASGRWDQVGRFILRNLLGLDPDTKGNRKKLKDLKFEELDLSSLSDVDFIYLFELVVRRSHTQM